MCSDEYQVVEIVTLAVGRKQNLRNNVCRQTFTSLFYLFYPVIQPRHKTRKTKKRLIKLKVIQLIKINIKLKLNYFLIIVNFFL